MTIERYTQTPQISEYLVVDENTDYATVRAFCWGYVDVSDINGTVAVFGELLVVGIRVSRGGGLLSVAQLADDQQIVTATNPVYVVGER